MNIYSIQYLHIGFRCNSGLNQSEKRNLAEQSVRLFSFFQQEFALPFPAAIVFAGIAIRSDDSVAWDFRIEIHLQRAPDRAICPWRSGFDRHFFVGQSFAFGDFRDNRKNFFLEWGHRIIR